MSVRVNGALRDFALRNTPDVEVLKPEGLREEIREATGKRLQAWETPTESPQVPEEYERTIELLKPYYRVLTVDSGHSPSGREYVDAFRSACAAALDLHRMA